MVPYTPIHKRKARSMSYASNFKACVIEDTLEKRQLFHPAKGGRKTFTPQRWDGMEKSLLLSSHCNLLQKKHLLEAREPLGLHFYNPGCLLPSERKFPGRQCLFFCFCFQYFEMLLSIALYFVAVNKWFVYVCVYLYIYIPLYIPLYIYIDTHTLMEIVENVENSLSLGA